MSANVVEHTTDPTGRCFLCYRRSHEEDAALLIGAMLDIGIPPWQDRRNLAVEPLAAALRTALAAPDTSGALVWVSRNFGDSDTIMQVEAPCIFRRAREDRQFIAEVWLTDNLNYDEARPLIQPAGTVEDVIGSWNVSCARPRPKAGDEDRLSIDLPEAHRIVEQLLLRRLKVIHSAQPPDEPLRFRFNAHADAGEAFLPGCALQVNWPRHFQHRFAHTSTWEATLLPALEIIFRSVRHACPRRKLLVEGQASLASCLALGRVFREVADIDLSWLQKPSGAEWSLKTVPGDSGFRVSGLREQHLSSRDLAVMVSVTGDVEPAVRATLETDANLRFRAIASVAPADGSARRELMTPSEASGLARLTTRAIREARHALKTIERTHLFLAGPAGLALMIGQQLNALGPVQTYEHLQTGAVGRYIPAALLQDPQLGVPQS